MVWAILLGVAVGTFYAVAPPPTAFGYDDEMLVVDELRPRSVSDLSRAFTQPHYGRLPYYRPVVRVTYLAQKAVSGDSPAAFRLVNAVLAGLLVPLAYLLLRQPIFSIRHQPALIAAVLFTVHPVASSCVLPIAGRDTLLPSALVLLCVYAWLRDGRWWRVVATIALAAALFGKEQAVITPALLVLVDVLWPGPMRRSIGGWIARYAGIASVMVFYGAMRALVLSGPPIEPAVFSHPGVPLLSLVFAVQTLVAPRVGLFYEPAWPGWFSALRSFAAAAVIALLAVGVHRRRATCARPALFWTGWIALTLLPTANLVVQETRFDERYLLLPSLGLFALAATVASAWPGRRKFAAIAASVGVLAIVALAPISFSRARYFEEPLVFYEQWVRTGSSSPNAHNGLGVALAERGRTAEAIEQYGEAIRLEPDHANAHNNLGLALVTTGRTREAYRHFQRAIAVRPDYAEAHYNLANLLATTGETAAAAEHYLEALKARPGYVEALNNYGALLFRMGRLAEAMDSFARVIELDPAHVGAHVNHGILLARQGRLEEALPYYREALLLDPDHADAHFDLAAALEVLKRTGEAAEHYDAAAKLARDAGRDDLADLAETRLRALE